MLDHMEEYLGALPSFSSGRKGCLLVGQALLFFLLFSSLILPFSVSDLFRIMSVSHPRSS